MIKKTPLSEYENVRKNGLLAIALREDDELIEVKFTNGNEEIIMVSRNGMSIRFAETEACRPCGEIFTPHENE
jgi:DNA gyrase subunit A